jgi:hypothetical protein
VSLNEHSRTSVPLTNLIIWLKYWQQKKKKRKRKKKEKKEKEEFVKCQHEVEC